MIVHIMKQQKSIIINCILCIVRYIAKNNNRVLVGCRLVERLDALEKMIYAKQRMKMTVNQAILAKKLADTYKV